MPGSADDLTSRAALDLLLHPAVETFGAAYAQVTAPAPEGTRIVAATTSSPWPAGAVRPVDAEDPPDSVVVPLHDWLGRHLGQLCLGRPTADLDEPGAARTLSGLAFLAARALGHGRIRQYEQILLETSATVDTDAFVRTAVRNVARVLETRMAFVAQLDPDGHSATTLVFWAGDHFEPSFTYDLAGTPCADVYDRQMCVVPSGVQQAYPDDLVLQQLGVESYVAIPFFDASGRAFAHIGVMHDRPLPTDLVDMAAFRILASQVGAELARRRAEAERLEVQRQLMHSQATESLGVLAGNIAHDLNNLLVGVVGNLSLALDLLPPDSPARPAIADADATSERAAGLMRQLLAYAGGARLEPERVDLAELAQETRRLMDISLPKQVEVELDLAPGLPGVMADLTQLRQVLMNLVLNGAQAIGDAPGRITLRTSREDDGSVSLAVIDTGEGMTPEVQERIFDPYFTTKASGSGLGLAAVRGVVRSHGGRLKVDSSPGQGSSFTITLPASREPAAPPQARAEARPAGALPPARVLIVDDDDLVRRVSATMLGASGFQVDQADSGEAALAAVDQGAAYDLVLLDMTMPGMSGPETLRALRARQPDLPVLVVSGFSEQRAHEELGNLNPAGFLQKPFRVAQLAAKVGEILSHGPASGT